MSTEFKVKCNILSEFYEGFRTDSEYADFFEYNDLGLPLAFVIESKIVESTPKAVTLINETFELLCEELELDSDEEFESLDEMLALSGM
jgi:hypothetical protein